MNSTSSDTPFRDWTSLGIAVALGPLCIAVGYHVRGLVLGAAAGAWILVCAVVVPALVLAARRFKFLVWQVALISITVSVLGDALRLNAMHRSEVPAGAFVFWAGGTLFSSPLPVYLALRPLSVRQCCIAAPIIALGALLLWLGIKSITG